jgi:aerobic carbon-monoxide dehydrogenase medium subunit
MATLSQLEHDANVAKLFPVLKNGLRRLSNPRVRNVARVGGALAHGDPHMDLPPMLTALGARITIRSPRGEREIPLEQLYAGYYETVLQKNELITAATVPALGARKAAYMKVTSRTAEDWPSLGVAVTFAFTDGTMRDPIVVASAATEKVTRMPETEKLLQGVAPEDAVLRRAGDAAAEEASILSDAHGSAAYKRELLRVYLRRAVRQALGQDMRQVA